MKFLNLLIKSELSLFIVCLFSCLGIFMVKFSNLPPQIPLYYSQLNSEKQITDLVNIWILPVLAALIIFINRVFLGSILFKDNKFVDRMIHLVDIISILIFVFIFIKVITMVS